MRFAPGWVPDAVLRMSDAALCRLGSVLCSSSSRSAYRCCTGRTTMRAASVRPRLMAPMAVPCSSSEMRIGEGAFRGGSGAVNSVMVGRGIGLGIDLGCDERADLRAFQGAIARPKRARCKCKEETGLAERRVYAATQAAGVVYTRSHLLPEKATKPLIQ